MYKRFNETTREVIIVTEWVEMVWHGKKIPYYKSLGYRYTKRLDTFMCRVSDLSHSSEKKVMVRCPVCEKDRYVKYCQIHNCGHTLCKGCAKTLDLRGEKFGRWTVLDIDTDGAVNGNTKWFCRCDCGEYGGVFTSGLTAGISTSCGCYNREITSNMSGENSPHWKGGGAELTCEWCGNNYYVDHYASNISRFCSMECSGKWRSKNIVGENHPSWMPKAVLICKGCGREYESAWHRVDSSKFCSAECYRAYNVGKNNVNWKSHLTDEDRADRRISKKYREWVHNVFERDKYKCQSCGDDSGGNLNAHHKYDYSSHKSRRFDIDNGVTLCEVCHYDFHVNFMGGYRTSCTKRDFEIWLMTKRKK